MTDILNHSVFIGVSIIALLLINSTLKSIMVLICNVFSSKLTIHISGMLRDIKPKLLHKVGICFKLQYGKLTLEPKQMVSQNWVTYSVYIGMIYDLKVKK